MPAIRYTFTATGHPSVVAAYSSIRSASARTSAVVSAHAAKTAGVQIAMMNRVKAQAKTTEGQKTVAAASGASKRQAQAIQALQRERAVLRQLLAEYTAFEKRKTAAAAREGAKRVNHERRNQRKASPGFARRFGGRVLRTGGSYLALGAGFAVAGGVGAAVRENVRIEDLARDIAVRGREVGGGRLDPRAISAHARQTALRTPGARGINVLEAQSEFLEKTGDLKKAQEASGIIADIAIATGANMKDVAGAAASLFLQFGTGKDNMEDMRKQLALFVIQGKKGAFEMKDMSKGIERMATAAKVIGVRGDVGQVATIGALAQFARRASGGPERAVTSLEGAFNILLRKQGHLQRKFGFDAKGTAKEDLAGLFPKLFKAIGGDSEILGKVFSKRALTGVIDLFNEFEKLSEQTGSQTEAADLLTQKIREMATEQGAVADISKDLADQQKTAGARLDTAWNRIVEAFGSEKGVEAINSMIDVIVAMSPVFDGLAIVVGDSITAMRGLVYGVAGLIELLPGGKELTRGLYRERDIGRARAEMQGQAGIATDYKNKLTALGYEPGQLIPERLIGTPHEKEFRDLQRGYESAESIRAGKEAELVGLVGGKDKLTDAEKADLARREEEYTYRQQNPLLPEDPSFRTDEAGNIIRRERDRGKQWQIPGIDPLAQDAERARLAYKYGTGPKPDQGPDFVGPLEAPLQGAASAMEKIAKVDTTNLVGSLDALAVAADAATKKLGDVRPDP